MLQVAIDPFHNGRLLIYSSICMIISLSDLVSMCKTQKNSSFQTRSERLIIIFKEEHIQRQNTRPDEQRYGTSSCRKSTLTVELVFAILEFCLDLNWQLVPMQSVQRKCTVRLRNDKSLREYLVGTKCLSLAMMPTPLLV